MKLNEQHVARAIITASGISAYKQHMQTNALKAMLTFIDTNENVLYINVDASH